MTAIEGELTDMATDITDVMVPEWIKQIGKENALEARDLEDKARVASLREMIVRTDGPPLVRRILKELSVQALACKAIHVQAVLNDVSREADMQGHQHVFRLNVTASSPWSKTTYVDISYSEGERFMHFCPRDTDPFNIEVVPDEQGRLAMHSPLGPLPTVEDAAQFILQPVVKSVTGR